MVKPKGFQLPSKLKNLLVGEVSLVDKGANNKRFHLMKSATQPKPDPKADEAKPDPKADEAKPEPTRVEKALAAPVEGEDAPVEGADAEDLRALRRIVKGLGLAESVVKAALGIADPPPAPQAKPDDLPKDPFAGLPAEARATVEAVFKEATELKKALETEREAKAVAESIQKAAQDFKNLPEKADALGPVLRAIRKADATAADFVENLLKRADAVFAQALTPVGQAARGEAETSGSTWEKVQKRAQALVRDGKAANVAKAVADIFAKEPELYTACEAEKTKKD